MGQHRHWAVFLHRQIRPSARPSEGVGYELNPIGRTLVVNKSKSDLALKVNNEYWKYFAATGLLGVRADLAGSDAQISPGDG